MSETNMHRKGTTQGPSHCQEEEGSALVLAIFVLVILTVNGLILLSLGQNEMKMGSAGLNLKRVYYLAEAGVEDGRATLADNGLDLTASLAVAAGVNGVIDFDPQTIQPVFDASGNFVEFTGTGDDVPLLAAQAMGDGSYAVFLTNDLADADPLVDANERVLITGVAAGAGEVFEVVQAMVVPVGLMPTPPPCAITLLGPNPYFHAGTDECTIVTDAFGVDQITDEDMDFDGTDCEGSGVPGLNVPTVCVAGFTDPIGSNEDFNDEGVDEYDDTYYEALAQLAKAKITDELVDDACPDNFVSGTSTGAATIANLDDYLNEPLLGAGFELDPTWTDCYELRRLIEKVQSRADFVCNETGCEIDKSGDWDGGSAPTLAASSITVANGDLLIPDGFSGSGLLVVTGRLTLSTTADWDGTLLIVGKGEFIRAGGAGAGELSGAVVVANVAGVDRLFGTDDDCQSGTHGFESATYVESGVEWGDTTYCSNDIEAANPLWSYEAR